VMYQTDNDGMAFMSKFDQKQQNSSPYGELYAIFSTFNL